MSPKTKIPYTFFLKTLVVKLSDLCSNWKY